jgi:hypothetical protein
VVITTSFRHIIPLTNIKLLLCYMLHLYWLGAIYFEGVTGKRNNNLNHPSCMLHFQRISYMSYAIASQSYYLTY